MSTEVWRYQTEKAEKEKATALSSSEFTLTRTSLSPHNLPISSQQLRSCITVYVTLDKLLSTALSR